jgi:hypothetical protein
MLTLGHYYWLIVALTVVCFGFANVAAHFIYFLPSIFESDESSPPEETAQLLLAHAEALPGSAIPAKHTHP